MEPSLYRLGLTGNVERLLSMHLIYIEIPVEVLSCPTWQGVLNLESAVSLAVCATKLKLLN